LNFVVNTSISPALGIPPNLFITDDNFLIMWL